MKRIFFWIRSLAWIAASMFSLSSCFVQETEKVDPAKEIADISFIARMPATSSVSTRAGETETGTVEENRIDNIYVLSFKNDELVYKGKAKSLEIHEDSKNEDDNNNLVTFKATLPVGECDLMLLANAEDLLLNISVGETPAMTKTDVEALVLEATAEWKTSDAIPMWDELEGQTLTSSSNSLTFFLTRMLARINVEYKPGAGTDVFRLTGIRYYNYNTAGKLVPANMGGSGADRYATAPTLPDDPGTETGGYLEYLTITDGKTCKNQIYVFEAKKQGTYDEGNGKWIDNPCLVISGKYDSDRDKDFTDEPETWYRIDFVKKVEDGEEWLSLLRNFSYNVTINLVTGDGYRDPEQALNAVPMNINAGIIDWNDGQMSDITVDGANFLSVGRSRNEGLEKAASLYRNKTSTDVIKFNTNIDLKQFEEMELTENGEIKTITDEEKEAGVIAKIANEFYEVKIVKDKSANGLIHYGEFVFTALKNYAASNPKSTLTVTLGRIKYTVGISQRDASPNDWENGGGRDEELGKK